jgi:hypothetical protein
MPLIRIVPPSDRKCTCAGTVLIKCKKFSIFFCNCSMKHLHIKSKRIPSIFKDESTGSCICLWKLAVAVATYVSIRIGHTCNTMRMRHDTIIKCATLDSFCFFCSLFPSPPPPSNEMRHAIHDTRISSGQCPRRDVTVRYGLQGHTEYTPRRKTYICQKNMTYATSYTKHVSARTLCLVPVFYTINRFFRHDGNCTTLTCIKFGSRYIYLSFSH